MEGGEGKEEVSGYVNGVGGMECWGVSRRWGFVWGKGWGDVVELGGGGKYG